MYRGYKTYRHYLNAKLHALSAVISGDNTVIDAELAERGLASVKELTTDEARLLYRTLSEAAKKVSNNMDQVKAAMGQGKMTDRQRAAIIKIAKYKFNWSNEALFSYIAEMFPNYLKHLTNWEIKNSKLYKLFGRLTAKDADRIIKRLDQIQKRNKNARKQKD